MIILKKAAALFCRDLDLQAGGEGYTDGKNTERAFFLLKRGARRIFEFFGIYTPAKQLFFKVVRRRLCVSVALLRERPPHLGFRFVDIPNETIPDPDKESLRPHDAIVGGSVSVTFGSLESGRAQVCKYAFTDPDRNFWAVTDLWTLELFRETGLEAELIKGCHSLLEPLCVRKLYFITNADTQERPFLRSCWGAKLVDAWGGINRHLLPRDLPDRWGFRWPFVPLLRLGFFCLQHFSGYRTAARSFSRRWIRYDVEDRGPEHKSVKFSAYFGKHLAGSVVLTEKMTPSSTEHWIFTLGTSEWLRGWGIGESLMRRLIDFAGAQRFKALVLNVNPVRKPAIALYKKLGFVDLGLDGSGPPLRMEKRL